MPRASIRRSTSAVTVLVPALLAVLTGRTIHAGFTFATGPAPGGWLQACAGPSMNGGAPWPGGDFTPYFTAPGSDVHEVSFVGSSSAATAPTVGTWLSSR